MKITQDSQSQLRAAKNFAIGQMNPLPYHNYQHVGDVVQVIETLARLERVPPYETFLLKTAGYLHDIVYDLGVKDNEERSAKVARDLLKNLGYMNSEVGVVEVLIMATKLPTNPKSELERIICDADVDNLGREDFFEKMDAIYREQGMGNKSAFYQKTLGFLESHQYYTNTARMLRYEGLKKNIIKLKELIKREQDSSLFSLSLGGRE